MKLEKIEEIIDFIQNRYFHTPSYLKLVDDDMRNLVSIILSLMAEVKKLREGIERHKRINLDDFELYKLLEK